MEGFDNTKPSQGLGDTIAKITHATGLDKVAEAVASALGQEDCGCGKRRELLNQLVPYRSTPETISTPTRSTGTYKVLMQIHIAHGGQSYLYFKDSVVKVDENHPLAYYVDNFIKSNVLEPVNE